MAILSEKNPGRQRLCWGLNLSYFEATPTVVCMEGSDGVLSAYAIAASGWASDTWWLLSRDWGRRTVRFVRLALKVVIYNDADFVELLQLYSFLTSALDGVGSQRHPWRLSPQGRVPVPIVDEAEWAPGQVWTGMEKIACPHRDSNPGLSTT
jgi:hypothetical protein